MNPAIEAIESLVRRALELPADADVTIGSPPDPKLGDFAVPMFPFARALRAAPPALAQRVVAAFEPGGGLSAATAAGPYVNVRVDRAGFVAHVLGQIGSRGDDYGSRTAPPDEHGSPPTVVIDYSSPNISKHLAYHHIRSTMIGHSLTRIYRALGWHAVGFNFVGDWGTTHGMLLAAWEMWGEGVDLSDDGVTKLNELYVRYRAAIAADPTLDDKARAWFQRLEQGEPAARSRWEEFRRISLEEFEQVYSRLGVSFEGVFGESFYEDRMEPVIADLEAKGLTSIDEGALVVRLDDVPGKKKMPPCLLRKGDGATLYATRDLASAVHRYDEYRFERALYVVGKGQTLHFRQWFAVAAKAGYAFAAGLAHVPFGQMAATPCSCTRCWTARPPRSRPSSRRRTPTCRPGAAPRSRATWATARSCSPTCRASARRTSSSTGIGCSRSKAIPGPTASTSTRASRASCARRASTSRAPTPPCS
jgi:arginyl-tRNA synthetase